MTVAWNAALYDDVRMVFPTLKPHLSGGLAGFLPFKAAMKGRSLILNPSVEDLTDPEVQATYIADRYEVVVREVGDRPYLQLPGSRVPEVAERRGVRLIDVHLYGDQSACYAATQEVQEQVEACIAPRTFIEKYAVPFLYGQAYYEQFGTWPFGELSHGPLGLVQWLGDRRSPTDADVRRTLRDLTRKDLKPLVIIAKRARWHQNCLCGSGLPLRRCHPAYKLGIDLLRGRIAQGQYPALRRFLALVSDTEKKSRSSKG